MRVLSCSEYVADMDMDLPGFVLYIVIPGYFSRLDKTGIEKTKIKGI
jgi:hypothetical protein